MSKNCVVVDYGIGNTFSVVRALDAVGVPAILSSEHQMIESADRLILPGVGAFGRAAQRLRETGLDEAIVNFIRRGNPFLGICVGMQLLMEKGYEFGEHSGLGLVPGSVEKIVASSSTGKGMPVPIIGWYPIATKETCSGGIGESLLAEGESYYFVHSFSAKTLKDDHSLATIKYGEQKVTAAVGHDNVLGTQFHPEKSGGAGLRFLSEFVRC